MRRVSSTPTPYARPSGVTYRLCGCNGGKYAPKTADPNVIVGATVVERCTRLKKLVRAKVRVTKFY